MNIKTVATKMWLGVKKASPTIAVVSGIGFGIAGTIFACKATLEVDKILDEAKTNVEKIHETADNMPQVYTENAKHRDLCRVYVRTAGSLVKNYGKAIACGGVSIALIIGGHRALLKRVAALGATCGLLGESLRRYRASVREQYGEEAESDIYYGVHKERFEETVTDPETGKEKKVKTEVKVVDNEKTVSPFAVFFDISNPNYQKDDAVFNANFISDIQGELTGILERQGWLFLNDARRALGYKPVPEGQIYGWIYDKDDPTRQNKVDLGIDHISKQEVRDFRNGYEKVFLIDFNVDGPIIESFHLFDKSNRAA